MYLLTHLDSRHGEVMTAHLLALCPDDRADRFMAMVSDDYVRRYVDGIGYGTDILIGAVQGRRLVGLAHAAVYLDHAGLAAEVGVSVHASARRQGVGRLMLVTAIEAARRVDARRVVVVFRAANQAMAALTRSVGGCIERNATESSAVFEVSNGPDLPLRTMRDVCSSEALRGMYAH